MSHFISKCSCGTVLSQCRCFSKEKIVTVVPNGCTKCKVASSVDVEKVNLLKEKIADVLFAGKGPFHPCGKCFKWKECDCTIESDVDNQDQLAVEIKKKHTNKD